MQGIRITKIQPIIDEKGETVELFKNLPGKQVSLYKRKKGTEFAFHFHKGGDPAKDPEYFYLISGKIKLFAENKKGEKLETEVEQGSGIVIEKMVYHEMEALTDVVFIEYRSTVFDKEKSDCFSKQEFYER